MSENIIDVNVEDSIRNLDDLKLTPQLKKFISNELVRLADPYTPFQSGALKANVTIQQDGEIIEYDTPYANYLWYGKLMVDPITGKGAFHNENYGFWSRPNTAKVLTQRDLIFNGGPLRGPKWIQRAFADNSEILNKTIYQYLRSNTKWREQ